jgi:hypothetical protein
MAITSVRINAPVGTRYGKTVMPNQPGDLATVTDLFDRIPFAKGGTREIGGLWANNRALLIAEVTTEIVRFQTVNKRPVIDGVIDPAGGTLKLMNQLAMEPLPGKLSARVVPAPEALPEAPGLHGVHVVDPASMPGLGPLRRTVANANYVRKLVRVDASSIKWYGVVVPKAMTGQMVGGIPHINFTPTPIQGGYHDGNYDSFSGWAGLWRDYTSVIGGQVAASGVNQVLVIPFYRTGQASNLGDFLTNWREVISAVLTAALNSVDPLFLRDKFTFERIVSSSFSNGWMAHQKFHTQAAGAADMTDVLFDLDGVAGGSNWRPAKGVIYQNRQAPAKTNPVGNIWYVGGRWNDFKSIYGGTVNGHAASRNHLLYHGLVLRRT